MAESIGSVINSLYDETLATQTTASSNKSMTENDFWKLFAAELQYQDMSNPMSNADMMAQMTQMSSMSTMSKLAEAISNFSTVTNNLSTVTLTSYSTGLLGKEVTIAITNEKGEIVDKVRGVVSGVDLTGTTSVYVNGTKYDLAQVMAVGNVPESSEGDEENKESESE
ncbi:MAG: hypothetical protein HFG41_13045 [Coprococcus sp.]|nr:hypothetical protein [Coprococcus sp.]